MFEGIKTRLTLLTVPQSSAMSRMRSFNSTFGTSRTLEEHLDYAHLEHLARTNIHISHHSLYCEPSETTYGIETGRRDISLPSMSFAQQESALVDNTSTEKGDSVMPVEAQSPRQGPVRRAEDAGIRIAGGPPGRQIEDWGGSRRGSGVASSICSTLPPAYDSSFD